MTLWEKTLEDRVRALGDKGARYLELEQRCSLGGGGLNEQECNEHNMLRWLAIARLHKLYGSRHGKDD